MSVRSTSLLRMPAPVMTERNHFSRVCMTRRSLRAEKARFPSKATSVTRTGPSSFTV